MGVQVAAPARRDQSSEGSIGSVTVTPAVSMNRRREKRGSSGEPRSRFMCLPRLGPGVRENIPSCCLRTSGDGPAVGVPEDLGDAQGRGAATTLQRVIEVVGAVVEDDD